MSQAWRHVRVVRSVEGPKQNFVSSLSGFNLRDPSNVADYSNLLHGIHHIESPLRDWQEAYSSLD